MAKSPKSKRGTNKKSRKGSGKKNTAAKAKPAKEEKPVEDAAKPAPPPAELKQLGPPPKDPLAQQAYLYEMLVVSAYDVARDDKLSPRERRKELRVIAAAAQKLMPRARLHSAEQRVLNHQKALEQKASERKGARLVPRPQPAPAPAAAAAEEQHAPESTNEAHGQEPKP